MKKITSFKFFKILTVDNDCRPTYPASITMHGLCVLNLFMGSRPTGFNSVQLHWVAKCDNTIKFN